MCLAVLLAAGWGAALAEPTGKTPLEPRQPGAAKAAGKTIDDRPFAPVRAQIDILQQTMADAKTWEEQNSAGVGVGKAAHMVRKAELYAVEKQLRERLQAQVKVLLQRLDEWQVRRREDQGRKQMAEMQANIAGMAPSPQASEESTGTVQVTDGPKPRPLASFTYYETKTPANVTDVAALPEVYGDAALWRVLYNANADKIPTGPTQKIAAGTVLIVPNIKIAPDFEF